MPLLLLAAVSTALAQKPGGAAPSAGPGPTDPGPKITATQKDICQGGSTILTATPGNIASTSVTYSWSPNHDVSATTGAQVVVNPLVTTTYTVAINISGAVTVRTIEITVNTNCCQYSATRMPPNVVELTNHYDNGGGTTTNTPADPFHGYPPGTYFHVAGGSGGLELLNGDFFMPVGSVLLLEANDDITLEDARLTLNGSTITAACDEMWGSLVIPDDCYGVLAGAIGTLRPRLMHSRRGLAVESKSPLGPMRLKVDQMDFLDNYQSMSLNFAPVPASSEDYITRCTFDSDLAQMKSPYNTAGPWYTQQHVALSGDFTEAKFNANAFRHALLGINLVDTGALPALKVTSCQFSDLYLAGITSGHQSITPQPGYSLEVTGSQFTFPKETSLPATTQVSQTLAANPSTLNPNETVGIGAQNVPLTVTTSTFAQPDASPYATFNYPAYRPR